MTAVLLVRHGQASWGAADYDVLSELGERQSRLVGEALAARIQPDVVVHGAMRRQRETAARLAQAAGWSAPLREDPGWDEMNHLQVLARHPQPFAGDTPTPREFQAWFEAATERWTGGEFDHEYDESFASFSARVSRALATLVQAVSDSGTAVVVTSGGPIARIAADLLGGSLDVHRRLAPVVVNASVTKVVVGSRGCTLVSFNDHAHLETEDGLLSYR